MTAWSKVSQIEAGHFDVGTAYASVDRHRLADMKPYIYRTHDGGKTWTERRRRHPRGRLCQLRQGRPEGEGPALCGDRAARLRLVQRRRHWQPLQNNMPVTSVRDIVVHGDDLAIATHGRGFWVMDQMTALRELASKGTEIAAATPTSSSPARPWPSTKAARTARRCRTRSRRS